MIKKLFNLCMDHVWEKKLFKYTKNRYGYRLVCKKCKIEVEKKTILTVVQGGQNEGK